MKGPKQLQKFAVLLAVMPLSVAFAQEQPTTPPPPAPEQPATQPPERPKRPDNPLPDLDELLGLTGGTGEGTPLDDPTRSDLDRLLSGAEIGNAFRQAVTLMGDVAKRMVDAGDAGLNTQRMQETIIRRLDQLISSLEQQQQQQQQQQQSSSQTNQANQKVPSKSQQESTNEDRRGDNTGQTELPGRKDGNLRPALDAARASWGNLPDRIREKLVQGSNEKFSTIYTSLTEAYYKKLAEQGKPR